MHRYNQYISISSSFTCSYMMLYNKVYVTINAYSICTTCFGGIHAEFQTRTDAICKGKCSDNSCLVQPLNCFLKTMAILHPHLR
jgi:hypothetical protein